jgi:glutamate N-acetyltransferase/amino-acid N-acetyltransferase
LITLLEGGVTTVPGFLAAGVRAGIKRKGLDLMLLYSEKGPVPAAGAFTTNRVKGAPLLVTQRHLRNGRLAAVVANSGVSNVFTGKRGLMDAQRMAKLVARLLKLRASDVAVASTGLIGAYLPMKKIERGIRAAVKELSDSREAGLDAARAIMTTDTVPKEVALRVKLGDGRMATIAGMAKGSGMINPRLRTATMFAFLVTDAAITPGALKQALGKAIECSFNMLNVDNETSTSDMVLILANGKAGNRLITLSRPDRRFQEGLECAMTQLASKIAGDGEGATKLIEVHVNNARNSSEAKAAAKTVAGSNLLKAAIFGEDPNWGRVVAALGRSGAEFSPSGMKLEVASERGSVVLVRGERPPSKRILQKARDVLRSRKIEIHIDLGVGKSSAVAWGCDLTYDYVRINSRYTT